MIDEKPFIDIELFPCSGGMAEGYRRAGIEFDLAVEFMENHCDSYEANLGHRPVCMDVRALYDLLIGGWRPNKPVRHLLADPPCVSWSRAGKRLGQDDPRDMLDATVRIVALLQPATYMIANVPGLDDGPNLPIVQRTIGSLSKHGYCTADFARLNAANYGTPQHRHRPFWFGHKAGPCITWPAPTHGDPDALTSLPLPGVTPLLPWVTCREALGFLSPDELGRPIKLRRRQSNSAQHGSVAERPARVVTTSNLGDGNVLVGPDHPRAGKRGKPKKNHGTPQGQRVTEGGEPAPTVTRHLHHTVVAGEDFELIEDHTGRPPWNRWEHERPVAAPTPKLELVVQEAGVASGPRARDRGRQGQGNRVGDASKPSATVVAKAARVGAGESVVFDASTFTIQDRRGGLEGLNTLDRPSKAILRNTHGNGSVIVTSSKHPAITASSAPQYVIENPKHPNATPDAPAPTMGAKQRMQGSQVLQYKPNHPPSKHDAPAMTQRGQAGHHDESYSILNTDGDGIVISERAAAILQGFPDRVRCNACSWNVLVVPWENPFTDGQACECGHGQLYTHGWIFIGETKEQRWSMIGQAMPATLAHPVAESVVQQLERTRAAKVDAA